MSEDFIAYDLVINLYSATLGGKECKKFEEFLENTYHDYYRYSEEGTPNYKKIL